MTQSRTIAAVLVAAGESRRMGDQNKLALTFNDRPLLRHATETLLEAALSEIVVVIGHEADWAREILADLPVSIVENDHYRDGQVSSVNLGLGSVRGACDGIMIALADMPLLTGADLNKLVQAYQLPTCRDILVPFCGAERGNPSIIATHLRERILAGDPALGCRRFMDSHPELVTRHQVDNDHYIRDVDNPADYKSVIQSVGTQH